jgi:hypothetical protein
MLDFVVDRSEMKEALVRCLELLYMGAGSRKSEVGNR